MLTRKHQEGHDQPPVNSSSNKTGNEIRDLNETLATLLELNKFITQVEPPTYNTNNPFLLAKSSEIIAFKC